MYSRVLLIFSLALGMCFILIKANVLGNGDGTGKEFVVNSIRGVAEDNGVSHIQERGHLHKTKKLLKHIQPFLVVGLLAKLVVVPLLLKFLIAATSSAFVMSKIALVTSAIIAMSWFLGASKEKAKLQIVQYPVGGSKLLYGGWNVKEKYTPNYSSSLGDWNYDDNKGETYDKQVFL